MKSISRKSISRPANFLALTIMALTIIMGAFFSTASSARETPESFAGLVRNLLPTVVNVQVEQVTQGRSEAPLFNFQVPPGSPLEDFLEEFRKQQEGRGPRRARSEGSGFIISADGYIVTNNHVIGEGVNITVVTHDGNEYNARLVGSDQQSDLALLKINAGRRLPAIQWGDSSESEVGDWVIAIGNPLGLGGSVTAGIISARGRNIRSGPYDDFIQTDAPINRGNSGGPLFNSDGKVIGVNTAIFSPDGGSIGIGFSIPSLFARSIIEQLRKFGETRRGWLGVAIQEVTPEIAESLSLGKPRGVMVSEVQPTSPADKAGVKSGDIILSFDGKPLLDPRRLSIIVAGTNINKKVAVNLWRGGKEKKLFVTVGQLTNPEKEKTSKQKKQSNNKAQQQSKPGQPVKGLGFRIAPLGSEARQKFGHQASVRGVLVAYVEPGGEASQKGITRGMVITELNQQKTPGISEFKKTLGRIKTEGRKAVLVKITDGRRQSSFVGLKIK